MLKNTMKDFLATTFQNYTAEMYDGNEPAGKGHIRVDGRFNDRWNTKYGGGESCDGVLEYAQFHINHKISISITGNHLFILDIRHDGKPDFWEYTNIPGRGFPGPPCCCEKSRHSLEPEKIKRILDTKIENCAFWKMVQSRAKELYSGV